jgi:hypothetical protein
MNAYDIAKDLEREGKFPGHVCYGTSPLLVRAANKLRKQADRISVLEANNEIQLNIVKKQQDYIAQLEKGLESVTEFSKALTERDK